MEDLQDPSFSWGYKNFFFKKEGFVMRIEIKKENYNRFLKRKEVEIFIDHPEQATPSADGVRDSVAEQTSSDKDKIEVRQIMSSSGSPESKGVVFVWDEKFVKKEVKEEAPKE